MANAELYWRAGRYARRVETVATVERHDLRSGPAGCARGDQVMALWRGPGPASRRADRAGPPSVPAEGERPAEAVPS